jgi:hypothetical protein
MSIDSALGCLYLVDVVSVAGVWNVRAAPVFRVEVSRLFRSNYCWSSSAQSFLSRSPVGSMIIFFRVSTLSSEY